MSMFNDDLKNQLKQVFNELKSDVTIALFTDENECFSCPETKSYMREVAELSDKIHLKEYVLEQEEELAKEWNIQMVPSVVLLNEKEEYVGIKFNGIPSGHEINSFIPGLLEVSGAGTDLPEELQKRVDAIQSPVNIKVFVTLGCPHCPGAVQKAHKLALESKFIDAEMIEAQTFSDISDKFSVSSVPKIVINDTIEFVGDQAFEMFLSSAEKAAQS